MVSGVGLMVVQALMEATVVILQETGGILSPSRISALLDSIPSGVARKQMKDHLAQLGLHVVDLKAQHRKRDEYDSEVIDPDDKTEAPGALLRCSPNLAARYRRLQEERDEAECLGRVLVTERDDARAQRDEGLARETALLARVADLEQQLRAQNRVEFMDATWPRTPPDVETARRQIQEMEADAGRQPCPESIAAKQCLEAQQQIVQLKNDLTEANIQRSGMRNALDAGHHVLTEAGVSPLPPAPIADRIRELLKRQDAAPRSPPEVRKKPGQVPALTEFWLGVQAGSHSCLDAMESVLRGRIQEADKRAERALTLTILSLRLELDLALESAAPLLCAHRNGPCLDPGAPTATDAEAGEWGVRHGDCAWRKRFMP